MGDDVRNDDQLGTGVTVGDDLAAAGDRMSATGDENERFAGTPEAAGSPKGGLLDMFRIPRIGTEFVGQPLRQPAFRRWSPLLTMLVFGVAFVVIILIWQRLMRLDTSGFTGYSDMDEVLTSLPMAASMLFSSLWLNFVPFLIGGAMLLVRERPMGTVLSVDGRLRGSALRTVAPVLIAYVVTSLGMLVTDSQASFMSILSNPLCLALVIANVLLSAFMEEFLFRGYMRQTLFAWVAPVLRVGDDGRRGKVALVMASVLSSGTFAMLHPYDWAARAYIFASGLVYCWLVDVTDGIEVSTAFHMLMNLMNMVLLAALSVSDGATTQVTSGTEVIGMLVDIMTMAFFALMMGMSYQASHKKQFNATN